MIQTMIFVLLAFLAILALLGVVFLGILYLIGVIAKNPNPKWVVRIKKAGIIFAVIMALNIGLVAFSQITASTPDIRNENGNTPENSIAELIEVELNGHKQWISLRGWDKNNPVLLFLAGGPGGTQMAAVRHELSDLEKDYVVVNWDQPGSGKSYDATDIKDITVETYIEDGQALTEYLTERFDKEKIYLIGESWGSALGIFLIDHYPESYHGFIGTGQMIDFEETERMDYQLAMEIAREKNDRKMIGKLEDKGVPPYYGKDVLWRSATYLNYLSHQMSSNPEIHNSGYNTFRDIGSSEYGMLDKVNYARGIINTFNHVYQQLYDIDLREDYAELEVPVYFFLGRHDLNAPTSLVEEYVEILEAPEKEILWFEHSGHNPWINERDQFVEEVRNRFSLDTSQN